MLFYAKRLYTTATVWQVRLVYRHGLNYELFFYKTDEFILKGLFIKICVTIC